MKSFSINVSDKSTAIYLQNYLTKNSNHCYEVKLEHDDNFFVVIISFSKNTEENYKNFIYNFSDFIIDYYEKKIVDYVVEDEYFYFNKIDKDCIYTFYIELKNISFENECLSSIESSVNFYFSTSDFVNLDGLIHFGIRDFNNKVKNKISDAVNSFIVEKEYEKFLDMLKEYIETSKSKIYRIHLIYLNSIATLLDDNGKEIELENISANHILSDFDFSKNDYVLNTLISLAPKEIILHLLSPSDNFIDAISQIFSSRVKICKDCEYCKKYHDDI